MPVTAPILTADQVTLAQVCGENLNLAKGSALLSDSDVGGSNTYITMQAAIATAAATKPAEFQGFVGRLQRSLTEGFVLGLWTDANVQAASTLADLVAISGANSNKYGGPIFIE